MRTAKLLTVRSRDDQRGRGLIVAAGLVAFAFVVFQVWFAWVGFIQADDLFYARAAEGWVEHGPFLAQTHWGLRHAIVLPIALFFKVFGRSEITLEATSIIYLFCLLGLVFACASRSAGALAGIMGVVLLASVPMVSRGASLLCDDIAEAVFVLSSLVCFHHAWDGRRVWLFILSGALAGLGAITRETTVCLLFVYLILFVAGYKGDRSVYVWMGLGFLFVTGIDTILLWAASGDPMYRLHVTLRGVAAGNPGIAAQNTVSNGLDQEGVIAAPRWLQAPLMMLANQAIGPVLWLAIPAAIMVAKSANRRPELELPRLLALLALVWFVGLAYVFQSLFLVPRYQTVCVAALVVSLGISLSQAITPIWRWLAAAAVFGVIAAGVLLVGVSDRQFMFSERRLVDIVRSAPGRFWTDPGTYEGARWLLALNGDEGRVEATLPPPGGLYVFNSKPRRPIPRDWPIQTEPAGWAILDSYVEPGRPFVWGLQMLGVWRMLPNAVVRKLDPEPRMTVVLRAPA